MTDNFSIKVLRSKIVVLKNGFLLYLKIYQIYCQIQKEYTSLQMNDWNFEMKIRVTCRNVKLYGPFFAGKKSFGICHCSLARTENRRVRSCLKARSPYK